MYGISAWSSRDRAARRWGVVIWFPPIPAASPMPMSIRSSSSGWRRFRGSERGNKAYPREDSLMRAVSTAGQWQAMRICRLFGTSPQFAVCRDKASASGARDWLLVLQRSRVHQSGISARGTLKVVHQATRTQWTAPRLDSTAARSGKQAQRLTLPAYRMSEFCARFADAVK